MKFPKQHLKKFSVIDSYKSSHFDLKTNKQQSFINRGKAKEGNEYSKSSRSFTFSQEVILQLGFVIVSHKEFKQIVNERSK